MGPPLGLPPAPLRVGLPSSPAALGWGTQARETCTPLTSGRRAVDVSPMAKGGRSHQGCSQIGKQAWGG